jgi:hypothetical protein
MCKESAWPPSPAGGPQQPTQPTHPPTVPEARGRERCQPAARANPAYLGGTQALSVPRGVPQTEPLASGRAVASFFPKQPSTGTQHLPSLLAWCRRPQLGRGHTAHHPSGSASSAWAEAKWAAPLEAEQGCEL